MVLYETCTRKIQYYKILDLKNYFKVIPSKKDCLQILELYDLKENNLTSKSFYKFQTLDLPRRLRVQEIHFRKFYCKYIFDHHFHFDRLSFMNTMTILRHISYFLGYGMKYTTVMNNNHKYNIYSLYLIANEYRKSSITIIKGSIWIYFN
jgi:hypothetical protein